MPLPILAVRSRVQVVVRTLRVCALPTRRAPSLELPLCGDGRKRRAWRLRRLRGRLLRLARVWRRGDVALFARRRAGAAAAAVRVLQRAIQRRFDAGPSTQPRSSVPSTPAASVRKRCCPGPMLNAVTWPPTLHPRAPPQISQRPRHRRAALAQRHPVQRPFRSPG